MWFRLVAYLVVAQLGRVTFSLGWRWRVAGWCKITIGDRTCGYCQLGHAPGQFPIYSSHYPSADAGEYPDR